MYRASLQAPIRNRSLQGAWLELLPWPVRPDHVHHESYRAEDVCPHSEFRLSGGKEHAHTESEHESAE